MPSFARSRQVLALAFCTALPFSAPAEPLRFEGYEAFYRSLGGNLFEGAGSELSLACTEAQQCLWVNAMAAAVKRYDSEQWSAPGALEGEPPAGMPEIAFDGQRLDIGERHWSLAAVTDLAPADWQAGASIDPEGLHGITAWRKGESFCLELPAKGSGRADRYTQVLLVQGQTLYNLPPLFASCAAVREAPKAASSTRAMPTWKRPSITSRLACGWTTCNPAARRPRNTTACSSPTRRTPSCSKPGSPAGHRTDMTAVQGG